MGSGTSLDPLPGEIFLRRAVHKLCIAHKIHRPRLSVSTTGKRLSSDREIFEEVALQGTKKSGMVAEVNS